MTDRSMVTNGGAPSFDNCNEVPLNWNPDNEVSSTNADNELSSKNTEIDISSGNTESVTSSVNTESVTSSANTESDTSSANTESDTSSANTESDTSSANTKSDTSSANTEIGTLSAMSAVCLNDNYLPWNDYFMGLCFLTSARSKDPNTKVGACIVDKENRIISMGYNGMPRGIMDKNLPWIKKAEHNYDTKYPYVCHAEMNAIMNGRKADFDDACLYVTKFPCAECAKLIIQSGINRVIFAEKKPEPVDEQIPSLKMFALAGVICKKFIPSVHSLTLNVVNGEGSVSITK